MSNPALSASQHPLAGMLYGFGAFSLFACGDAIFKWTSGNLSVFQGLATAFLVALLLLVAWAAVQGRLADLIPRYPARVLLRSLLIAGALISFIWAISRIPLADGYALAFAAPLIVAALSPLLLQEPVDRGGWIAVLVGFAGVLIMLRPGFVTIQAGHLAALTSAALFAAGVFVTRRLPADEADFAPVAGLLAITVLITVPIAALNWQTPSLGDSALLALVGLGSVLAHVFLVRGFRLAAAAQVAPFQYVQMVWGLLFGLVIFGDPLEPMLLIGVVPVIASGIYLLVTRSTR